MPKKIVSSVKSPEARKAQASNTTPHAPHPTLLILLLSSLILLFTACSLNNEAEAQTTTPTAVAVTSPTATPTSPPPPPVVAYTPVAADTLSPIIVQRVPARGEVLNPDGVIELVFDRAMNQTATAGAFTLQVAAEQPDKIEGQVTWSNERTMRFTPAQPLDRDTVFDAILTQSATAQDGAPLAEPFTFRFSTAGYLEVGQVIPADGTADVETNAAITVMFNRPIVPLTGLQQAENFPQPLEFEPAISGKGEWLNTSIYVFRPDKPMGGGVTYKAKVKAGLTDAAGDNLLAQDFTWNFTTQPPEVVSVTPGDGQTLVPIETPVQVVFNQPVDPQSAQAKFSLNATRLFGGGNVTGTFSVISETLTFTPTERLAFDTTYQVTLEAGVTSQAGGNGMLNPYSFSFTTVPLPKIIATQPQNGESAASPYTNFRITFNTPISPETVMPHLSMTPPLPITPTQVYTYYSPWDNSFSISFGAKPSSDYEVRITPGIEDPYGNKTQENLTVRFRTAPLNPNYLLRVPDLIGTYDADLPAKMIVTYVNVNTLNLRLYRLDPALILRPYWEFYDYQPDPASLLREWQERLEAPADEQSFKAIDLVEGGGVLEPGLYLLDTDSPQIPQDYNYRQKHIMVVTKTNLTLKAGQRDALVWATNMASGQPVANLEIAFYDGNGVSFGTAMTDQEGVARLDLSSQTSRSGLLAAVLPDGSAQGFTAVAENWSQGVSPYDFGLTVAYGLPDFAAHIYTDRPIYRPGQTVNFKGVIRAEDDVNFKRPDLGRVHLTVRNPNGENILDQQVDLSPAATFNGEVKLEEGAALGAYVIGIDFNSQYFEQYFQVAAYRAPEFQVTVEPARTELLRGQDVAATINTSYFFGGPLANAQVSWNVLAESFRFSPAQLGSYSFDDSDDPYVCFDCWWYYHDTPPQTVLSGSGVSDASGQINLKLDRQDWNSALAAGSYRLTIEATATGADNQVISGRASIIMHKGDYYIGLSPQEYVADAGKETAVNLVAVDWAAQRLPNKELDVQILRYEWVNTFVEEGGGGYWTSETRKELIDEFAVTTDAQGEAVARFTPPKGGSYQIIAQDKATLRTDAKPADPEAQAEGLHLQTSSIRSSLFVWVAGDKDISWRRENNDRITLISDKAEYTPGETAEILIPSPFQGEHEALITIERGRIIEHQVIKMTNNSYTYQLPITDNYVPNIYVSVVLVQGREGPQEGDAPRLADYKVGILPLDVKPVKQLLKLSLTPSVEQGQPGQEINYNIAATTVDGQPVAAAELSLDLVDKAVLTLLPRPSEAIVKAFYDRRGLGITTSSGLAVSGNLLLLELAQDLGLDQNQFAEQESAAGGVAQNAPLPTSSPAMADGVAREMVEAPMAAAAPMAEAKTAAQPAPLPPGLDVREDFSDTAYWNPVVVTDDKGQAQVSLKLPDNLTTWVMRGVGLTEDTRVGEGTSELIVTKPLLIRPVTPRFLVVDDRAELAANVTNNTDQDLSVEVTLAGQGVNIQPDTAPVQTVSVPARGESKVTWNVTVPDVITTELIFAAVSGDYNDAAKPRLTTGPNGSLKVLRYTAPDIVGTAGQLVDGGSQTEVVALPPNFDARNGELSVQLDPGLAAGMRDGLSYLEHYEYECAEQTVSRFLPNVLTYNALQQLGIENKELADRLPGLVEQGLNKLYTQQNSDGGWGWWPTNESNVYVTSYVVFALTKARQVGVDVSATVLANGQNFLLNHISSTFNVGRLTTYDANRYAFILYALAEGGQAPSDILASLFDAREKLAHYGRAYLALALNLSDQAGAGDQIKTLLSDLNNTAILSATGAHWEEDNYDWWAMNTDTRSTAIILDALARLDPDNALIPNVVRWLMIARKEGIWETTQETAWALIALTDWMVQTGELNAAYDYNVSLNGSEKISGSASKENVQQSIKFSMPIANLLADAGNRLAVARTDGNGRLYYSAHLKVYLPVEKIEPVERGVNVSRRYRLESCLQQQTQDQTVVCNEVREAQLGDVIRVDLTIIAPHDLYYVVVEDPLPAGAEAIDTGLATTSLLAMDPTLTRQSRVFLGKEGYYGYPYYWWWWRWYSRSELRDEKVVLFADYLPKGTYEYSYTMRATLPGDYHVIPTVAHEFYFPEVFGRSDGRLLSIGR